MWGFGNQSGRMWQKYDNNKRAVLAAALPEVLFGNWEPLVKNNACWWEVEEGRHGWYSCKKEVGNQLYSGGLSDAICLFPSRLLFLTLSERGKS